MKTHDARWTRIRDLFEQAADLKPEERTRFLDEHCSDDAELRQELAALLESDVGQSVSPITGAIGNAIEDTTREHRQELLGSIIGPYRLTSIIGHGGAGTVYLGERIDRQYSAKVAIKIVEGAALSAEIGRRFRAERQILANLNHPAIARLIDAGETERGYPYLVMEYVHGEPIDVYCDKHKLDIEARITLLLKVCDAVRYAHQNLTVHRDIKPANILIGPDGNPKLLDFGIAKLLDTSVLAADMALTRMNDRVLTPEYASPEQILGNAITTATDVYSLGMVLYELLTGLRPYKVSATNQLELEKTICITDPTTPSAAIKQALRALHNDPSPTRNIHNIALARGITPMRLRARLEGDLDAIILRALRKELEYRYSTIDQFAGDLQAYLAREPVKARQGNWFYYAKRFTRKHAFGVSVTAGFIVVLGVALAVTANQARVIASERDNANREKQTSDAVATFMTDEVFVAADPYTAQGREVTARELLDNATKGIRKDLDQQPVVKARLLEAIGYTYHHQGEPKQGVELLEEAFALRQKIEGSANPALASTLIKLGRAKSSNRDHAGAQAAFQLTLNLLEKNQQTNTREYAQAQLYLAIVEMRNSNLELSLARYEKVLPLYRTVFGPAHPETATALFNYGNAKIWASDFAGAETLLREAVQLFRISKPELHPDRMDAESMLGTCLLRNGNLEEAAPLIESSYRTNKLVFGETSARTIEPLRALVYLRRDQQKLDEAERFAREALSISIAQFGEANSNTAQSREILATILLPLNKLSEADRELRTALKIYRDVFPPDHLLTAASEHFLAEVLLAKGQPAEAVSQLEQTIPRLHRLKAAPWRIARSENTLGQSLIAQGEIDRGKELLSRSYEVLATTPGVLTETVRLARSRLDQVRVKFPKS